MPKEFKMGANETSPSGMETVQNLTKITGKVGTTAKAMPVDDTLTSEGSGAKTRGRRQRIMSGLGEAKMQKGGS